MSIGRVDITGQFSPDNPISAFNNTEIKVVRDGTSLQNIPSNWSSFCDAADDALRSMLTTKKLFCSISFIFILVLLTFYIMSNILPFVSDNWIGAILLFVFLPTIIMAIPFVFFWFWIRSRVKKAMRDLDVVCQQHSHNNGNNATSANNGGGFSYTLDAERWSGLNFSHVKRYYITVRDTGGAESGNDADVEQPAGEVIPESPTIAQIVPTATPVDEEFQDDLSVPSVTATTDGGRNGPSFFDQLSGS